MLIKIHFSENNIEDTFTIRAATPKEYWEKFFDFLRLHGIDNNKVNVWSEEIDEPE